MGYPTAWGRKFRRSLVRQLGKDRVVALAGNRTRHRGWPDGAPRAVFWHWTAGAATESTDPKHPGNQKGANNGVVAWCHHPSSSYPWCNIVVDRDGTVYLLASHGSAWHSGVGTFRGTEFERLGIGDNAAHYYTLGIEVVDKGLHDNTFTKAQWTAIDAINVAAREASGWKGWRYRIVGHHTWAPSRKSDIETRYPLSKLRERAREAWGRRSG